MKTLATLLFICFSSAMLGQDYTRFPFRIPDWLWKDELRSAYISNEVKAKLEGQIINMDRYYKEKNEAKGDSVWNLINSTLNEKLAKDYLLKGAEIITSSKTSMGLQIDPDFDKESKEILKEAAGLFLAHFLDEDVINEAYDNSIINPSPYPSMYVTNTTKYTDDFAFLQECITKPESIESFKAQMSLALETKSKPLLVISAYRNNIWWGRAYLNYYKFDSQCLKKFFPNENYLYIGINKDSLKINKSPKFWASKVAHEVLHNLGYWHPGYKDPDERNKNNSPKNMAFIVAYEFAILRKLKGLK